MKTLRTVILHHTTTTGSHYDWLMEAPPLDTTTPQGMLWTARIEHPPEQWQENQQMLMTPLPAHRMHYLTYQGQISDNRGSVRRIAQGRFTSPMWTNTRRILHLTWNQPISLTMTTQITLATSAEGANWFEVIPEVRDEGAPA